MNQRYRNEAHGGYHGDKMTDRDERYTRQGAPRDGDPREPGMYYGGQQYGGEEYGWSTQSYGRGDYSGSPGGDNRFATEGYGGPGGYRPEGVENQRVFAGGQRRDENLANRPYDPYERGRVGQFDGSSGSRYGAQYGGPTGGQYGGQGFGMGRGADAGLYGSPRTGQYGQYGQSQDRTQAGRGARGLGPKGYRRSDERLQEDICERLTDDWQIDASDISVRVADGVVTLEGSVPERRVKHRVEDLIESCGGVTEIRNQLTVSSSSPASTYGGGDLSSTRSLSSSRGSGTSAGASTTTGTSGRSGSTEGKH